MNLIVSLFVALNAAAVPAQHVKRVVRLEDGSTVIGTLYGNSKLCWLETAQGEVLMQKEGSSAYVRTPLTREEMMQRMAAAEESHGMKAPRRIGSQSTASLNSKGVCKIPVLLVSFADKDFSVADTDEGVREYYDLFCNGTRDGNLYKGHGSYGAIRDYFVTQSDSIFLPDFVVIGPVKLDKNYAYYGKNNGTSLDVNYTEFRKEAVGKAVDQFDVDWLGLFDNRGKSQVDMLFIIYAGMGEANGGDENTIWPKDVNSSVTINNIRFDSFACCNELRPNEVDDDNNIISTQGDGVGIMCHELSHALGLPDFYDTRGAAFGMDIWSVMDYGEYCVNGYCPVSYTAYERDFMGWRPLQTITEAGSYELLPTEAGGIGYKVVNPQNASEYYVLENRQSVRWDRGIGSYGSGMQVTHVDYNASSWNSNLVNVDAKRQRMTIIAANNRYEGSSAEASFDDMVITWSGNLFPYEQNDSLTDNSIPAATVYTSAGFMGQPIYDIRKVNSDGNIRFNFLKKIGTGMAMQPKGRLRKDEVTYDLSGRRAAEQQRNGIYIQNGRKRIGRK